jgi:hypothetical protein
MLGYKSIVGFEVLTAVVMKTAIFWDITPCSRWLARWFHAELIFSTLKMEAICFSETSVDTQRTTRHYIPEDGSLYRNIVGTKYEGGSINKVTSPLIA